MAKTEGKQVWEDFEAHLKDHPEIRLLTEEELSNLRIKNGKSHKKEKDWAEITALLKESFLLVCQPTAENRYVKTVDHLMEFGGNLLAFTNLQDMLHYLQNLGAFLEEQGVDSMPVTFGTLPFADVIAIADSRGKNVSIDDPGEKNVPFLRYTPENASLNTMYW